MMQDRRSRQGKAPWLVAAAFASVVAVSGAADAGLTAYSMVTRDGRRLVSRQEGTNEVFELVATNALPKGLPPVRPWTIYAVKAAHTDIGLHNSQYVQRHGSVRLLDAAAELIAADRSAADPGAYRYVVEGYWFWHNYALDRGPEAARRLVDDFVRSGRLGVGVTCAGNLTQFYSPEQVCRSIYTRKALVEKWGVGGHTMLMIDNPGVSWSIVQPYADAGVRNLLFAPNQWCPRNSTIWPMDRSVIDCIHNPEARGGGSRIDVRWGSELPMAFWWEAPDGKSRLLTVTVPHYYWGLEAFGVRPYAKGQFPWGEFTLEMTERRTAKQLERMNARYPFDVWISANYMDDEPSNDRYARFCREWNAKWATPRYATVGDLDEPFERLRRFGDRIPVVRGEMTSAWTQFMAAWPKLLSDRFAADRLLTEAEMRRSLAAARGGADYPAEDFRRAWWGIICSCDHSYPTPQAEFGGRRIYETCAQHADWVAKAGRTAARLAGTKDGEPRTKADGRGTGALENRWYRISVNGKGEITSIYDKELGRELLADVANRLLYTRDNHATWEKDPAAALGAEIRQEVWLDPREKRILVDNVILHARALFGDPRYLRYGYFAFPFAVPKPRFLAQLGGPVIDAYKDLTGHTSDSFCCAREWVAAENGEFGVALMQLDSALVEFGDIHADKTGCAFGKPPERASVFSYAFTDWIQANRSDGEDLDLRFRYAITSYRGTWRDNHLPRQAERWARPFTATAERTVRADRPNVILTALKAAEDGNGFIARFRETEGRSTTAKVTQSLLPGGRMTLTDILENGARELTDGALELAPYAFATVRIADGRKVAFAAPASDGWKFTELISAPVASCTDFTDSLYLQWGVSDAADLSHYELWRAEAADGAFAKVADVKQQQPGGIPYRNTIYEDRGLKPRTRYWYKVRPVFGGGRTGKFTEAFTGKTREKDAVVRRGAK